MIRFFLPFSCFIFLLFLNACGLSPNDPVKDLNGTWVIDTEKLISDHPGLKEIIEKDKISAERLVEHFKKAQFTIDINARTLTTALGEASETSPFAIKSQEGGKLVLHIKDRDDTVRFIDKNTISVERHDFLDGRLILVRQTA